MKAKRSVRTSLSFARTKWTSVPLVFVVVAAVASPALWSRRVVAETTLDPNNPGLFQTEGTQTFTPGGGVLKLNDTSK